MKPFAVLSLAFLCGLPSCEKAREFVGRYAKKPVAEVPAPAEGEVRRRLEVQLKELPEQTPAAVETKPETPQPSPQTLSNDGLPPGMRPR